MKKAYKEKQEKNIHKIYSTTVNDNKKNTKKPDTTTATTVEKTIH